MATQFFITDDWILLKMSPGFEDLFAWSPSENVWIKPSIKIGVIFSSKEIKEEEARLLMGSPDSLREPKKSLPREVFERQESTYRVDLVDQFQGHDEGGYARFGDYKTLKEAVVAARELTEEALINFGSFAAWRGVGDAGLVYDSKGNLLWDGVREYTQKEDFGEVFRAIQFATKAHTGQFRKGTKVPYIVHPIGVSRILIENGYPCKLIVAGLLHDALEDTSVSYEDIKGAFGRYVAEIVKSVSTSDSNQEWRARKQKTIDLIEKAPGDVFVVECADKLDNIRAIRQDYAQEGEGFWDRFNSSKEDQKWYYTSLARMFAVNPAGKSLALVPEFKKAVVEVFGAAELRSIDATIGNNAYKQSSAQEAFEAFERRPKNKVEIRKTAEVGLKQEKTPPKAFFIVGSIFFYVLVSAWMGLFIGNILHGFVVTALILYFGIFGKDLIKRIWSK